MEVQYVYTKKRAEFGRHANFSDRPAESHVDIAPDQEVRKNFLHRNPCHAEVQASYPMSEHYVNTEVTQTVSTASNHVEGGWPKDVNPNEMEQVARYRKKVEKDEAYIQTILKLASIAEDVIRSNNAIDIYEDYFNEEEDDTDYDATPRARTVNVFRDPCEKKRSAVHMSWHPDGAERLVAAYSDISFQQSDSGISYDSYVWNSINPNKPEMILRPPAPSVCVEYNPKDAHEILSGLKSGQVCIWDTRRGGVPVMTSNRDVSHRDPVHSALWMQSKTGKDFFSGSTDGLIKWWDARKLDQPLEELILDVTKNLDISKALGCVSLEFESTIPTKFMVGTEHGCIISCNRKAKTQQDKIAAVFSGHVGPVYSLQRNPIFPKMFLSVGDWSAKIFSEDIRDAAIYSTPSQQFNFTSSCWSPTRPGVFYTSDLHGHVDVWDMLSEHFSPSLRVKVSNTAIRNISAHSSGSLLACGADNGELVVLRVSDSLVTKQKNEKEICSALFERENKREKILDSRQRELRLKERQRSGIVREDGPETNAEDEEGDINANVAEDFERHLNQEQKKLSPLEQSLMLNASLPDPQSEDLPAENVKSEDTTE